MLYDVCVVTFIVVVTTNHMIVDNYTFSRMTRFWTMWSCWSCLVYFFYSFSKQVTLFFLTFNEDKNSASLKSNVSTFIADALQHVAVTLCMCVSLMFWVLYFNSPQAVFRVDSDWQPSFIEIMFVTHFEHSFPLCLLLLDCIIFNQGNKKVEQCHSISKYIPLVVFGCYGTLALHDFFRYGIRPYPFMDKFNTAMMFVTLGVVGSIIHFILSPIAYYTRKLLKF